jgi:hypothetical protein
MMKMNGAALPPRVIVPWSWRGDTHHEQAGLIGGADDLNAIENQRCASLGGNPPQPRLGRQDDSVRPDRRSVDALLLGWFCRLDEHPARPGSAQRATAAQQTVGPFNRLDAENEPLLHDDGLANIERADRAGKPPTVLDIGGSLGIRPELAERPSRQQSIRFQQIVDADHPEAFAL